MRIATLHREPTTDVGTFGILTTIDGLQLYSLEPPWRDNARGLSCIPPGEYECSWHQSPRFGAVYRLGGTAPREEILIHPGNWAGDVRKGYVSDSEGCILLGLGRGILAAQLAITRSKPAVRALVDHFQREPFALRIEAGA